MLVRLGYGLGKYKNGGGATTPAAPVNTVAPTISGAVTIGSTLTSTTGSWTGYPAPTFAYQWRRDGVNIGSATSATYVTQAADEGLAIDCVVTATNTEGSAAQDSNNIMVGYAPANSVAPAVTGTAEVGSTLSCSTGTWTGTATITYAYQWRRDGVNIGSATANTYTLVAADDLTSVDCVVTATNSYGSAALDSNNVSVTYPVPVNSVAPVASGTGEEGQTLSVTTGTWSNSPTSYTYQWRRGAVNITGATSSTYLLVAADAGTNVDCVVTASNSGGAGSGADSNDVAVAGGAVWSTYSEIELSLIPDPTGWVGILEVRVLDEDNNEYLAALTPVNGQVANTMASISTGQFTTTSQFNGVTTVDEAALVNNVPDVTNAASGIGGTIYWSNSGTSGLKIFLKPGTAKSIKEVQIAADGSVASYQNWIPDFLVKGDGVTLTPVTAALSWADAFQTTSNANTKWLKWTFDENS